MPLHSPADLDELLNPFAFVLGPGRSLGLGDARNEVLSVMFFHGRHSLRLQLELEEGFEPSESY